MCQTCQTQLGFLYNVNHLKFDIYICVYIYLPARASEQGNVIGSVHMYTYIYVCVQKKIVIEQTRDLNYLKFVATDFFLKTISPSAGENSGDIA